VNKSKNIIYEYYKSFDLSADKPAAKPRQPKKAPAEKKPAPLKKKLQPKAAAPMFGAGGEGATESDDDVIMCSDSQSSQGSF